MKKKILVIEDEISLRKALSEKLDMEGFDVVEAANGEIGLEVARNEKPDLILLDIIMPYMDGVTFFKIFKKTKEGKNTPIIVLSNLSDDEKIQESLRAESCEYLIKSDWKIDDVVTKVKEKLK